MPASTAQKTRFIYIHGNGTTDWAACAWAVWLNKQLAGRGYDTWFQTMPDPQKARASHWLPYLQDELQAGPNDVLIGWSSGAVAAMRYAETHAIKGSVLIAPCYTDLGEPSEQESGYYDEPWQWRDIKKNQKQIVVVSSDDDPYIPQSEFAYIALQLGAARIRPPGQGHFEHRQDFPEIFDYLTKTYPTP